LGSKWGRSEEGHPQMGGMAHLDLCP